MNYRLGAFGWLGGEKYYNDYGLGNLGLQDQAFAMKWVSNNIHLFGGASRTGVGGLSREVVSFTPQLWE